MVRDDAEPQLRPVDLRTFGHHVRVTLHIDTDRHPISDPTHAEALRRRLEIDGALVLTAFLRAASVEAVVAASLGRQAEVFYAAGTHNVYLTDGDLARADDHPVNRQIVSTKGLIAHDQIPTDSPLRNIYEDAAFRRFLCRVLGIDAIHPYADPLSSVNVHFAPRGRELGWHFDNSSFTVTMLLQAPEAGGGGVFEHVPDVRSAGGHDAGEFERVRAVLDGETPVHRLDFHPGDLVLFRGREALHRVTPTEGATTRLLAVFAFNDEPGISLSDSAKRTFYGRTA